MKQEKCWSRFEYGKNGCTWLVDEKPFIAFAGEIHNSSSSNPEYMRKHVWDPARQMNCNTLAVPVYWELCEPEEGKYDFSIINEIIKDASKRNLKLILLWFGSWKNATSLYVPEWVKQDKKRFTRVPDPQYPVVSAFCEDLRKADCKAFAALMKNLKKIDQKSHTVVIIQVENEIGILGDSRDHTPEAEKAFNAPVPKDLINGLKKRKSILRPELKNIDFSHTNNWVSCFGELADEAFSAWAFSKYVQTVAAAGRKEYPLPCFVNTWLVNVGQQAGNYPSGGPVSQMKDIWKIMAPDLAFLAPDIYQPRFKQICDDYTADDNPLFIDEAHKNATAVSNMLYAYGKCKALCFAPFGIEDMPSNLDIRIVGNSIEAESYDRNNHDGGKGVAEAYSLLQNMLPVLHDARKTGCISGYLQTPGVKAEIVKVDGIPFQIEHSGPCLLGHLAGAGILLKSGKAFYAIGCRSKIILPRQYGELLSIEKGHFEKGEWVRELRLNGDEFAVFFEDELKILRFTIC